MTFLRCFFCSGVTTAAVVGERRFVVQRIVASAGWGRGSDGVGMWCDCVTRLQEYIFSYLCVCGNHVGETTRTRQDDNGTVKLRTSIDAAVRWGHASKQASDVWYPGQHHHHGSCEAVCRRPQETSAVWLVADADGLWRAARCGRWLSRRKQADRGWLSLGLTGPIALHESGALAVGGSLGIWGQAGCFC